MTVVEIKEELHSKIESGDENLLNMIYDLVNEYKHDAESASDPRKILIRAERARYLAGLGKSYTPEEVREMAINHKRP